MFTLSLEKVRNNDKYDGPRMQEFHATTSEYVG